MIYLCPISNFHVRHKTGKWSAGFVLALSKKWKKPEEEYLNWYKKSNNANKFHSPFTFFELGMVQYITVEKDIYVGNMIAQHGIGIKNGKIPLDYEALIKCIIDINSWAVHCNLSIHMPKIGCGLAGGDWNKVEKIIKDIITVDVYVYIFK